MSDPFDEFIEHGREWIDEEIQRAREAGLAWTPWREMYPGEHIGATRCCSVPKGSHCTKVAVYVSYCTAIQARVVLCDGCLAYARSRKRRTS